MDEKTPILTQPGVTSMQVPPESVYGCPPGLEILSQVDQLFVEQMIDLIRVMTDFQTENRFVISNAKGQQVYFAGETSECLQRQCFKAARAFSMSIVDSYQREVLHLERPLRCQGRCCPNCLQIMEVLGPDKSLLGFIKERYTCNEPVWHVNDANDVTQLIIRGPCCCCICKWCSDTDYEILSFDGATQVGRLVARWSDCAKECYGKASGNFSISFPMDMSVQIKALLLASVFLINYMYYVYN
ncbi:phospholipid scramblase 2-like isoform X2 [Oscarella lobularis]|uniref:phospholipid scramblase 2-like isoform X2 n=1 Tax=Oscarella lobularis TaxID=121494 RepID=UPI0033135474